MPMVVSPHAEIYGMSTQLFSRINSLAVLCALLSSQLKHWVLVSALLGGWVFLVLVYLSALTPLLFFDADTFFKFFIEKRII